MPFLNTGRSGTAILWTGSYAIADGIEIGTGSSTKTVATTGLTTPYLFRVFDSIDTSLPQNVVYTANFSSTQISGITMQEIAVRKSGGTVWSADGFAGITFDGTTELQMIVSWGVF